jgi:DNA-binding CsgD family transcriptional regulator
VFIIDPETRASVAAEHLRQLYGLTAAEAAVAVEAVRGGGVAGISASLRISRSTVRTHLIRIFEKTGTSVHTVLGTAAGLRF